MPKNKGKDYESGGSTVMDVWVVHQIDDNEVRIFGIYDSEEKAKDMTEKQAGNGMDYVYEAWVVQ
jgi:hypothetical protein